jgi:hypothetical protein
MTCSGSFERRLLRAVLLGATGLALAAGCGGSSKPRDAGTDGLATNLSLDRTSLMFGTVEIDQTSTAMEVTVTNTGTTATGPLMVNSSSAEFQATGCSGMSLAAKATCKVTVTFKPSQGGMRSGSIMLSANPGGAASIAVSGTGVAAGVLSLTPDSGNFGSIVVNQKSAPQSFTLTNNGGAAVPVMINISGSDFTQTNDCGAAVEAGKSCTIQVVFGPTSGGEKTGSLTVSGGDTVRTASLRGTGLTPAQLTITPATHTVAGDVGTTSEAITFIVQNTGDQESGTVMATLSGADAGQFMVDSQCAALAARATCTVRVTMRADSAGMKQATLTVAAMPGGSAMATITGVANPPTALAIDPANGMFPEVVVGMQSEAQMFTIRNTGSGETGQLTVTTSSVEFQVVSNTCEAMVLKANETCTVSVVFKPTAAGAKVATLTVSGGAGQTRAAGLSGNAVAAAGLAISPGAFAFPVTAVTQTSSDVTFTITNAGGAPTGALSARLEGAAAAQFDLAGNNCNAQLAPGTSCTVVVRFKPTLEGNHSASLVVSGLPGGSAVAMLSGSAVTGATLAFSPTSHSYGQVVVGQVSGNQTFTITNTGVQDTGMLAVTLQGTNADDFEVVSNGCAMLAPGVSCVVTVRFKPAADSTGIRNASLAVTPAFGAPGAATLQGEGLALVEITPAVANNDFGSISVGTQSGTITVTYVVRFGSSGAANAEFTSGAADFTVVSNNCGTGTPFSSVSSTNPSSFVTCTAVVRFEPKEPRGAKSGVLTISVGGQSVTQAFSGTGVGPLEVSSPTVSAMVNGTTTGTFTVTNNGATAVNNLQPAFTSGPEFVVQSNGCLGANLAAGASCTVVIRYQPTVAGTTTGTLTVTGTSSAGTESGTGTITGTATSAAPLVTISPSPVDFGTVALTATKKVNVTVTNPSNAPTTGVLAVDVTGDGYSRPAPGQPGHGCSGGLAQLPPGASCTVEVSLTPPATTVLIQPTLTGQINVSYNLGTVSAPLTGTAVQALAIAPASHSFGNGVVADVMGPEHTFTVTNNGGAFAANTLQAEIQAGSAPGADDADYAIVTDNCKQSGVAAGGTCTVLVKFSPNADSGPSSAELVVKHTAASSQVSTKAALSGTQVPDATLEFVNIPDNETRTFGDVAVNTSSASISFTVRNKGGANAQIQVPSLAAPFFSVPEGTTCWTGGATAGQAGITLAPNQTCTVAVYVSPTAAGAATANLAVSGTGKKGGTTTTAQVTLNANGVPAQGAGALYATPSPADLGETFLNVPVGTTTFTFRNFSGSSVTIAGIVSSDPASFTVDAGNCSGAAVGGSGSMCNFSVTFNPTTGGPGYRVASVTVQAAGPTNLASVGVYGRVKSNAILQVTAPSNGGDFGDVLVGQTSASRTWTVANVGERAPSALNVANSDAEGNYTLAGTTCTGMQLAPGASCNVTVAATPVGLGPRPTGTITIAAASNLEGSPVTVATVDVRGVTSALLAPDKFSIDFGADTNVGNSKSDTVTIGNRLGVLHVQRSGPLNLTLSNNTDYAIEGCSNEIRDGVEGNTSCTLTVKFQPKQVGAVNGNLTISGTPGGSQVVTLTGTSIPSITITPSATQTVGANSSVTFTVNLAPSTNPTGTGALNVALGGANPGMFQLTQNTCQGVSLVGGGTTSCSLAVTYTGSGAASTVLSVSGTTAGNQVAVTINGQ